MLSWGWLIDVIRLVGFLSSTNTIQFTTIPNLNPSQKTAYRRQVNCSIIAIWLGAGTLLLGDSRSSRRSYYMEIDMDLIIITLWYLHCLHIKAKGHYAKFGQTILNCDDRKQWQVIMSMAAGIVVVVNLCFMLPRALCSSVFGFNFDLYQFIEPLKRELSSINCGKYKSIGNNWEFLYNCVKKRELEIQDFRLG